MADTAARQKTPLPIPRQSLALAVADRLREEIIRGERHEGEQLRQDAIAAEFQVSRIPVREAFRHLEAEGLIKIVANRGAVVSALSPDEIGELFEIRAVLECHILRLAIPKLTEDDFRQGEELIREYEQSLAHASNIAEWGKWNWRFHSTLYAPANRPVLMSLLKTLNANGDRYTRLHLLFTRSQLRAGEAHRALLFACRTRNADLACDALHEHIINAGEYLRDFIRRRREQRA